MATRVEFPELNGGLVRWKKQLYIGVFPAMFDYRVYISGMVKANQLQYVL